MRAATTTSRSPPSTASTIPNRLTHGRVAQTLLNAVIIIVANLRIIRRFLRDRGTQPRNART